MKLKQDLPSVLLGLLSSKDHKYEQVTTDPLFSILISKPFLIGFAMLSNNNPKVEFESANQQFKDLYVANADKWNSYDFNLVLFSNFSDKLNDSVLNEIENDQYFCRKYILNLNNDLEQELARLPFIPLKPEKIANIARPISAQSFLANHDVEAGLARNLVVPHSKAPGKIVELCLEQEELPVWGKTKAEKFQSIETSNRQKVRLLELEINNFRAYRGNHKFNLNSNLIVIYGPNGLGKTSLFDAIDFVCTGGVARLDDRFGRSPSRLIDSLKHLDASREDAFVKLKFSIDGEEIVIERSLKERSYVEVKGQTMDRTKVLMMLTGISDEPLDIRVENLIKLFRATHLFGQEFQSLTSELRAHSKLQEDIVSRMLAFQDYVEGISKSKQVFDEFNKKVTSVEAEIVTTKENLELKKDEKKTLSESSKILNKPKVVEKIGQEIARKVAKLLSREIDASEKINQKTAQSWRSILQIDLSEANNNIANYKYGISIFGQYESKSDKASNLIGDIKKINASLSKVAIDAQTEAKALNELQQQMKKITQMILTSESRRENLAWLKNVKPTHAVLRDKYNKTNIKLHEVKKQIVEDSALIQSKKLHINNILEQQRRAHSSSLQLQAYIHEIEELLKHLPAWLRVTNLQTDNMSVRENLEKNINYFSNEIKQKKEEFSRESISLNKSKTSIQELQKNQTELQTLLDQIEGHITNAACPTCGDVHDSKESLLRKIRERKLHQPQNLREQLNAYEVAKVKVEQMSLALKDTQFKLNELEKKYAEIVKEIETHAAKLRAFEGRVNLLGFSLSKDEMDAVSNAMKIKLEQYSAALKLQDGGAQKLNDAVTEERKVLDALILQVTNLEELRASIEMESKQFALSINTINQERETKGFLLDIEDAKIEVELNDIFEARKESEIQLEAIKAKSEELTNKLNDIKILKTNFQKQIVQLESEHKELKVFLDHSTKLYKKLDSIPPSLLILKKNLELVEEKSAALEALNQEIINYELALDSATLNASLASLQISIDEYSKNLKHLEEQKAKNEKWADYFKVISTELNVLRQKALAEYTDKYGPFASTIQKRLRPVFGFGPIKLFPEKGGISVQVERQKKTIAPSDFFSESQMQIIMLSLFMSAALTQTWSSFSPILMDDPVAHFDDLNAYSLLDLLRGLLSEADNGRQFIISTCEDRLYRLVRQKFSQVDEKPIFYVFESMGANGPVFNRVDN